jgi:hypothetical protein
VPATTAPPDPPTVVRLATVPHGDSVLAQGPARTSPGAPVIPPVDPTPTGGQSGTPGYLESYFRAPLPPGIPAEAKLNPNVVLTDAIQGQKILSTVTLSVSSADQGGVVNIPFVVVNANATRVSATFWIETVEGPDGVPFLQLQYSQTVILNFLDIDWPHVSVATLVKR